MEPLGPCRKSCSYTSCGSVWVETVTFRVNEDSIRS